MLVSKVYSNVQNGNHHWSVYASSEKNQNKLVIHSQSMGQTIFECDEVWDSDVLKIVRVLYDEQYNHYQGAFEKVIKKLNRNCRHLNIPTYIAHIY